MSEHSSEFDPTTFDPQLATEQMCWTALPQLTGTNRASTLYHLGSLASLREEHLASTALADSAAEVWMAEAIFSRAGEAFMSSGRAFAHVKDFSEAIIRCQQAIAAFENASDSPQTVDAMVFLGSLLIASGRSSETEPIFTEAHRIATSCVMPGEGESLELLEYSWGEASMELEKYENAMEHFQNCLQIAIDNSRAADAPAYQARIAFCLSSLKNYEQAIELYQGSYSAALLNRDNDLMVKCGINLATSYREFGDFDEAGRRLELIKPAVELSIDMQDKAFFERENALLHLNNFEYLKAFESAEKAYSAFKFLNFRTSVTFMGQIAGICLIHLQRFHEVERYLQEFFRYTEDMSPDDFPKFDVSRHIIQIWMRMETIAASCGPKQTFAERVVQCRAEEEFTDDYDSIKVFLALHLDSMDESPHAIPSLFMLRLELLHQLFTSSPSVKHSSPSSLSQKQAYRKPLSATAADVILMALNILDKCSAVLSPAQIARLHFILGTARSGRPEAVRNFARALSIYIQLEHHDDVAAMLTAIEAEYNFVTDAELESEWGKQNSQ